MFEMLPQLFVLFLVIVDPLASFSVFMTASSSMKTKERRKMALYAVLLASLLAIFVILFGNNLLLLFNTTIDEFRVAGGIILAILGIRMALGTPLVYTSDMKNNPERAVAAIIATPLLTGPATITALIITVKDYGVIETGTAAALVLIATAVLFLSSEKVNKYIGKTAIQMLSTIMGLITLSWGVQFIVEGLHVVIGGII
ncbi:MAG: MarC family protein [Candidatus Aenigmarchaeota archaeon]|nr:MarC family protein [Candidatus Aenigmarchaeota archaeon]